jgi:tetratricopeptide (TPR) repeat protein
LAQAPPEALEDNRFWRCKGWLHGAQDEFPEAEAAYRQALKLHPFDLQSQHELASVLRRRQRYDEVAVWQERALVGTKFRQEIFRLPNVQSAPKILLTKLVKYARDCGDAEFADHLTLQTTSMR